MTPLDQRADDLLDALLSPWCWWCARCRSPTLDPHTGPDDEDLCPRCCTACTTGQTAAAIEQWLKEHAGDGTNPGDPIPGHGLPSREQMATPDHPGGPR